MQETGGVILCALHMAEDSRWTWSQMAGGFGSGLPGNSMCSVLSYNMEERRDINEIYIYILKNRRM